MRTILKFMRQSQVLVGIGLVILFILVATFADTIAPRVQDGPPGTPLTPLKLIGNGFSTEPQPPSLEAPLGTTTEQYDIYTLIVWGARSALRLGLTITIATALIGIFVGAMSGYIGGWFNGLTMRVTDALLTFPLIAGVWLLTNLTRPLSVFEGNDNVFLVQLLNLLRLDPLMLGFILFSWMPYARLMNANVQQLKQLTFVQASEALGGGKFHVVWKHLIPNAISPALVLAARDVGSVVILATAFTYIGIGPYNDYWGHILSTSRNWIVGIGGNPLTYWWTFLPTTIAIILFGIGWNLLGDGINVLLNPRGE